MTDQEQYQIIGKVVSDHEKAKKHLVVLKAKGETLAEFLYRVGSALSGEAAWSMSGQSLTVKGSDSVQHFGIVHHGPDDQHAMPGPVSGEWPTSEAVFELLQEIEDTKTQIKQLEQQRAELGV